ncbi:MAG: acetyl-CoA carboxylase carboxyltransferase subunit alpha [Candidatus Riflebacteria bacterium]|nr:acetyl-CoA carboxylase carboxyltransferase subunit alpha [Candidatus Riflebacteria bacterium]
MTQEFEFERPITELEKRLKDLQTLSEEGNIDLSREITAIADKIEAMKAEVFRNLEPWQITQVARHIQRTSTLDYVKLIFGEDNFVELHGDRLFGEDTSIITGFADLGERPVALIGHQKGHDTEENIFRNFGMPHPEGYRKSMRIMKMAEKFGRPIIVFIDTPGAFPGIGAEERGQSEAIARSIMTMSRVRVPVMCFVIGEGGSGGALAIGIGDRVYMLEYSVYSVISAEGCAAILWKDSSKAKEAATSLKMRAQDLLQLGVIDGIIPEPLGGVHRNPEMVARLIKKMILSELPKLCSLSPDELVSRRYSKFRQLGAYKIEEDFEKDA